MSINDDGIKQMCIHTMEYYSAIKRNEVLLLRGAVGMNVKNITLSERGQTRKTTTGDSIYIKCPEKAKL